jgi:hypothetical protein
MEKKGTGIFFGAPVSDGRARSSRKRSLSPYFLLLLAACKVPVVLTNWSIPLSDITWFEDEQTLFVFYDFVSDQGIGPETQVELTYTTDDVQVPFTALSAFTMVHKHVPADCGPHHLCGSASVKVAKVPRQVGLQLRYSKDGSLTLVAPVTFNVVGSGPPWTRSAVAYGVFDEKNAQVQWRSRNQFPTIRNGDADGYGLRRHLTVADDMSGDAQWDAGVDPYGYGWGDTCPAGLSDLKLPRVETEVREVFVPEALQLSVANDRLVCGRSTLTDALGNFDAPAFAQKNPETRPAFPSLRSPIKDDTALGFVLRFCQREINEDHRKMQTQRLLLDSAPEICLDDWQAPTFTDTLTGTLRTAIDTTRAAGHDMVLTLVLNHDDTTGELEGDVETALEAVLTPESTKTSPRVTGAFLFDSLGYTLTHAALKRLVLWCPASTNVTDLDKLGDASHVACAVQPDLPDFNLGPFNFNQLPILPTRDQYETFVMKYSAAEVGQTLALTFRAPEVTPVSRIVPVGDFGVVTFFNDEIFTAAPGDAFSFCQTADMFSQLVVYEGKDYPNPAPISALPMLHAMFPDSPYSLGLAWDFPFLTRLEYQHIAAGNASAFTVTIPFGITTQGQAYYGTQLWQQDSFDISSSLAQCTRFCDNPTFDSGGVYNVLQPFRSTYAMQCYRPLFPVPPGEAFPLDP